MPEDKNLCYDMYMINQDLINFIKTQKELGSLKEDIIQKLLSTGWTNDDINEGFVYLEGRQILPLKSKKGFMKIIIYSGIFIIILICLFCFKKDINLLLNLNSKTTQDNIIEDVVDKNILTVPTEESSITEEKNVPLDEGKSIDKTKTGEIIMNKNQNTISAVTYIDSNSDKTGNVKLYTKPSNSRPLMGVTGQSLWIIADTKIPTTIQYTVAYRNSVVYPGAEQKENVYSRTVSVDIGKTMVDLVSADDGVVKIDFKYLNNTGKKVSEIKPAVVHELDLSFMGVLGMTDSDDLFDAVYDLESDSDREYSVTYTFNYKDKKGKDMSVTKTVLVPMGFSVLETSIPALDEPVLTYKINY